MVPGKISLSSYEAVVFWHVLEHIPEPLVFLEEVQSVLKSEGLLFLSVPNLDSFTNTVQGRFSPLFLERDHLFHYNPRTILKLVSRAHLQPVSIFSREEAHRLASDLRAAREAEPSFPALPLPEAVSFGCRLEAGFQGHELFCVLRKPAPQGPRPV